MRLALLCLLPLGIAGCVSDSPVTTAGTDAATESSTPVDASADSGSDTSSDVAQPWSPAALDTEDKLALWLEGSAPNVGVSNGKVGKWTDLSKHKTNAVNINGGPTVLAGAANGHDALHFGTFGVTLDVADAPSLQFADHQVYLEAVVRSQKTRGFVWSKATSVNAGSGPSYTTGLELFTETPTTGTAPSFGAHIRPDAQNTNHWGDAVFTDTSFHALRLRRTSTTELVLGVDDQPLRPAGVQTFPVDEAGKPVSIGPVLYGNLTPQVDFDIAELVVVHDANGVVLDGDVTALHAYVKKKYGL